MEIQYAKSIADDLVKQLAPHCDRIEIAGSIRRGKPEVKDIEIVAIPKPYNVGLFESGIATVVERWIKVKGTLPCKYTQREIAPLFHTPNADLPREVLIDTIKLDLFLATHDNWGLILAIRTGSAEYSHHVLANGWVSKGYESREGILIHKATGWERKIKEEKELFDLIGLPMPAPKDREWKA